MNNEIVELSVEEINLIAGGRQIDPPAQAFAARDIDPPAAFGEIDPPAAY
jgi:hypothetical protein